MAQGMELLDNGTKVFTGPGAAFGTDALLLARFAMPRRKETALDLCSGCGIVALAWHDAGHRGPCTAVELDADDPVFTSCGSSLNEQPRTFCRTVRRVADTGKVKHLRCGAEGIPSLNRALSQYTQTRNRVIYPCPG